MRIEKFATIAAAANVVAVDVSANFHSLLVLRQTAAAACGSKGLEKKEADVRGADAGDALPCLPLPSSQL